MHPVRSIAPLVLVLATACALFGPRISFEESQRAVQRKDYPLLQSICLGKTSVTTLAANAERDACGTAIELARTKRDAAFLAPLCGRRHESFGIRFEPACPAMLEVALAASDLDAVRRLCDADDHADACEALAGREAFADLAQPDCTTLAARIATARETFLESRVTTAVEIAPYVAALARCGDADTIFGVIAPVGGWGNQRGQALIEADELAHDELFAAFQAYLRAHPGNTFLAEDWEGYGARHLGDWLLAADHMDQCEPLVAAASDASEPIRWGLLGYFAETGCRAGAPLAVSLLASRNDEYRTSACRALGMIGGPAETAALAIVVERDTAARVVEDPAHPGVFINDRFVAAACQDALRQVELRAVGAAAP